MAASWSGALAPSGTGTAVLVATIGDPGWAGLADKLCIRLDGRSRFAVPFVSADVFPMAVRGFLRRRLAGAGRIDYRHEV
ncbi:hypothetical protein Raf01_43200 [Rugosimonospora africana]|uniref:Uncharacterized protein n=1 Tax=Rugosimonospora africana TaxID=556532 RepID=A0A8J3QUT2_9ACTN|nr:hypothetical protein Raf01_43200 [Rugosimonospora africana]